MSTVRRCESCRLGLLHFHCRDCSRPVTTRGTRCPACDPSWRLVGFMLAIAAWLWAFHALTEALGE